MSATAEALREQWLQVSPDVQIRTCWECNPGHAHFQDWDETLGLSCLGCGRWFYQGVDITIYGDDE